MCLHIKTHILFTMERSVLGLSGVNWTLLSITANLPPYLVSPSVTLPLLIYEVSNLIGLTGAKSASKFKAPKKHRFLEKL